MGLNYMDNIRKKQYESVGDKTDAKSASTDATSVSIIQLLKQISYMAQTPAAVSSDKSKPSATFTRPDDTTAYAAGDVVGTGVAANMSFSSVLATSGGMFVILSVMLEVDAAAIPAGMGQFRLHLFDTAPSAIADNTAWALADADRAKYIGYITIDVPIDMGGTLIAQQQGVNFSGKLATTTLYGMLETLSAYTPTASVVKKVTLNVVGA